MLYNEEWDKPRSIFELQSEGFHTVILVNISTTPCFSPRLREKYYFSGKKT